MFVRQPREAVMHWGEGLPALTEGIHSRLLISSVPAFSQACATDLSVAAWFCRQWCKLLALESGRPQHLLQLAVDLREGHEAGSRRQSL